MVGIAAVLLALQLVPSGAFQLRLARPPTVLEAPPRAFQVRRLAPAQDAIYVARSVAPSRLEIIGWRGEHEGDLRLPATAGPLNPGWGFLQSPSGARFLDGTLLLDITGTTENLAGPRDASRISGFAWRDDSEGACAVRDDGGGAASLVEFFFNPYLATSASFPLPTGFGFGDQTGPRVLACNRARRVVVVGLVGLDHSARVVVLDLVTGAELGRRIYPPGSAAGLAASPDGRLLALDAGPDLAEGPAGATMVLELDSGRVLLNLGLDLAVRAFSADGQAVLASSPFKPGAEVLRVDDGRRLYADSSDRVLLGWISRPQGHDFALAFGSRERNSCTTGEPGKFPQFCRYSPLQSLEIIASETGTMRQFGLGAGAWGYRVN